MKLIKEENFIMNIKLLLYCLFCAFTVYTSNAQDTAINKNEQNTAPYVAWVSQYPVHKDGDERHSAARKVYDFLIQKNKKSELIRPVAVVGTNPANFWVLDQGGETVFEVRKDKMTAPRSIKKKENYFTSLIDACPVTNGDILFTDSRLNKIFLFNQTNKTLSELNDTLQLQQPTGIAYSLTKNEIWVVETAAHRVSVLNKNGEVIKRIGSRGDENGQFNFPTSIWIDNSGNAYIVDAMNFRVQIFNKNGEFVSTFGEAGDASGSFARPKGIATDSYGNIYIVDALFHVVQIFDKTGKFLYSFGKQGREKEEFWMPAGIYIDSKNYIYVADSYNSRIQVFQLINGS